MTTTQSMTSRQRILTALRRDSLPDRVPVDIGIGPWFAAGLFGVKTIDLARGKCDARELMLRAYRRLDYDPWLWATPPVTHEEPESMREGELWPRVTVECDTDERHVTRTEIRTPFGSLFSGFSTEYNNPARISEKPVKDLRADWPRLRYWLENTEFGDRLRVDDEVRAVGIGGPWVELPVAWWDINRQGDMTSVTLDLLTEPDLMREVFACYTEQTLRRLDALLAAEPRGMIDEICIQGSSSSLSYSSLEFFKTFDLPFIQAVTSRTRAAGVLSHLHVCGRSRPIVELVHDHSDLDVMEPLEPPPGGNCDIAEVKQRFGRRLALKGNMNTFHLLRYGTPDEVREAVKRTLDAAMPGGGFWLSTGDQTPAETPEANLVAMIATAREFGVY